MSIEIKKYRKLNNLTQAEAACKIGVSPSAFAMYERGEREPGIDTLKKMSETFKVDIDTLVGKSRPFISYGPDEKRLGIRGDLINVTVKGKNNAPDEMILTESERKLIELLRRVPADQKGTAMEIVNGTLTALQKK